MSIRFAAARRLAPGVLPAAALLLLSWGARAEDPNPKFACLIEPKMVLKIGTPVPALLGEVLVDRGVFVKKGDVLARLESDVETATVALAKARAENDSAVQSARAKLNFQVRKAGRALELRRNDNIAISTADEAATGAKVAEA